MAPPNPPKLRDKPVAAAAAVAAAAEPDDALTPPPRRTAKKNKKRDKEVEERAAAKRKSAKKRAEQREEEERECEREEEQPEEEEATAPNTTNDSHPRILSRTSEEKIMLPTSDTPIQRKNRQFRKGHGERRRSSLGQRGRRASSMMESGLIGTCPKPVLRKPGLTLPPAEPHNEISHTEFYKHIDEGQMENARMKQLLAWCGKRELDRLKLAAPRGSNSGDFEGSARHIGQWFFGVEVGE